MFLGAHRTSYLVMQGSVGEQLINEVTVRRFSLQKDK